MSTPSQELEQAETMVGVYKTERDELRRDVAALLNALPNGAHDATEGVVSIQAMREAIREAHEALSVSASARKREQDRLKDMQTGPGASANPQPLETMNLPLHKDLAKIADLYKNPQIVWKPTPDEIKAGDVFWSHCNRVGIICDSSYDSRFTALPTNDAPGWKSAWWQASEFICILKGPLHAL